MGGDQALTGDHSSDEIAMMLTAGTEIAADFLSKHRPQSGGAPAPAPTCITAFSLTSLPDLLAANLDAQKMKAGLGTLADLADRLMRVDWSVATENMPACDHTQPLSTCTDYTGSSSCYDATYTGEATESNGYFTCTYLEIRDDDLEILYGADGTPRGICIAENWDDQGNVQCHNECEALPSPVDDLAFARKLDCYRACDTQYTICSHQIGVHEQIFSRDDSDGINHGLLANLRDFSNAIADALPDTDTRPPVCILTALSHHAACSAAELALVLAIPSG